MIIAVTGSPGTGKSTVAKELSEELGFNYIDLNKLIEDSGWFEGFDEERKSFIVDEKKLTKRLESVIDSRLDYVIDSHLSHFVDSKLVDVCIVCTCELKELKRRLETRDYTAQKVRENLDVEIFQLCEVEAGEKKHNIIIIDTTEGVDVQALAGEIRLMSKRE